ncbi:heme-degrading domain-containing protein [Tabrizicola sp. TH137]|uniref:heme-degrading domain-containing protein n=1 Tax=Tabrizicola sp. TH137 TaxID=2067452 RepID=UPI000C7B2E14|nr:heme-degrading domain-containing protein [Tabrizicola sp. TH137]PLL13400.1 heme-degrading domain-containing protein [Tabrizicola sp. TH137]
MDISELEAEAARLILPAFSEEAALRLGLTLMNMAKLDRLPIVIDIRTADRTLFHLAMPGSAPINDRWALRKSNTALHFHLASLHVGRNMAAKGDTLLKHGLSETEFAVNGGAVPICVAGAGVVACATVSGLPQVEDHRLVVRAIETLLQGA